MKKYIRIFILLLAISIMIPGVSAAITGSGNGNEEIKRETKTNYFTTISFKGVVTNSKTGAKEEFSKESSEITGNYSDTKVKNEINKLKSEFIAWAKEKGAINYSAGKSEVKDYYYDAHDEITQSHDDESITILTVLDKHQTYEVNYSAKIEDVKFTKGANGKYTIDSKKNLGFTLNADYSLFKDGGKVLVNNKELSSKDYTSKSGSTIITLKSTYLNNLSEGKHSIKVELSNGLSAQTNFTVLSDVKEPEEVIEEPIEEVVEEPILEPVVEEPNEVPETPKLIEEKPNSNPILYMGIALLIVVIVVIIILIVKKKKCKLDKKSNRKG